MHDLRNLATQACTHVQDITVGALGIIPFSSIQEVTIEYRGFNHYVSLREDDLETRTEEWLLDDLIAQFEKFKQSVDQLLHKNSPMTNL